jgi:hypothetical protein
MGITLPVYKNAVESLTVSIGPFCSMRRETKLSWTSPFSYKAPIDQSGYETRHISPHPLLQYSCERPKANMMDIS